MQAPRSLTEAPVTVQRRADLRAVETRHKHQSAVVVKDPVAMKYHRLRPDEYFVLQQLDGQVSLDQLRERYEREFAPQRVSTSEMNQLLMRLHQCGLTVSKSAMQGDRLHERNQQERHRRWIQQLSGILFIRFPGVDPEPLLRRLYPLARPLLSPIGMFFSILLCLAASGLLVVQWDRFRGEMPGMDRWLQFDAILILAAVIGVTKMCHELGHAIVCKHFGGECHQIGPMLLVFTPALYCDTSDSWMLSSRWQRAAVGLAGMATELLIAALATVVWFATAPGIIHYVAMNVMVVCSVSTVLFNANPLLRYDGYYVLSDLCDMPNLGEQSRRLLSSTVNRLLFGIDERPHEEYSPATRTWMLLYAALAFCYRWGLTLVILWFLAHAMRPMGLQSIGVVFCVVAATGMIVSMLRPLIRFLCHPGRRQKIRGSRSMMAVSGAVGLLALTMCPLPGRISSSGRVVAAEETPVYILTPGTLETLALRPGQKVEQGETLARLVNHQVELQYIAAKGRYETQLQLVDAIRRTAINDPEAANDLPAQQSTLEDLHEQLLIRQRRRDALTITAPRDGIIIEAPQRPELTRRERELRGWEGYPSDPHNQGCYFTAGDELLSIIGGERWEAELLLDQSEVERIRLGDPVKVILNADPDAVLDGKVKEISRKQWTRDEDADRRDADAGRGEAPASTSYAVRVELESRPLLSVGQTAITGMTVAARIETSPLSLLQRTSRVVTALFRFR